MTNRHWIEAMDRADMIVEFGDKVLGEHPVMKAYPELKEKFDDAMDACAELYQEISKAAPENAH